MIHQPTIKAAPEPALASTARQIIAEKPVNRFYAADAEAQRDLKVAAQFYLDNLADGYDEPDELLELLAESDNRGEILNQKWFYFPRTTRDDPDAAYDEAREVAA